MSLLSKHAHSFFSLLMARSAEDLPVDVLLDLDGTLTDSGDGITRCIAYALARLGRPSPVRAELNRYVGPPLAASFRRLLGTTDDGLVQEALRLYRERFVAQGMFENRVYPGIPAALSALRALDLRLWVATTKPQLYARQILAHFDLLPHFAGVYGSELNGDRADKGELIRHLLASERIAAQAAVMIGDREQDIHGARQNALAAIGVLWGYGTRAELEKSRPDAIVESPDQLVAAVSQLVSRDSAEA
jgi:phosphoglycolate phosphatase